MIQVKRGKLISNISAFTYRMKNTGEEIRKVVNLGALTGYIKAIEAHPNTETILIEVPHGWVQKTKDWIKKERFT